MSGSVERIVALDLGKFKSVACVMEAADRATLFETIETSPKTVHDLIVRHATSEPATGGGGVNADLHDSRTIF